MRYRSNHKRRRFAVATAVFLAVPALVLLSRHSTEGGKAHAQDLPLAAGPVDIDEANRAVHFDLFNTGTQAITAWAVEVTFNLNGGETLSYVREDDGFLAADLRDKTMIEPGGSRRVHAGIPVALAVGSVQLRPRSAIFEDVTAAGDLTVTERLLSRRELQRDELGRWLESYTRHLSEVAARSGEADGLQSAATLAQS